jgi:4-carboxymuconolactone decarboxylase
MIRWPSCIVAAERILPSWSRAAGERLDALFRTAPALGELAVGVVYGHLHERTGLDPRLREAATLAAIVAAGMVGPPLSVHLKTGLASGLAPGEVLEVLLQTAAFAGFPRAVSAADQLNRLFEQAGLASPPARTPRELVLEFCQRTIDGERGPLLSAEAAALLNRDHEIAHPGALASGSERPRILAESAPGVCQRSSHADSNRPP